MRAGARPRERASLSALGPMLQRRTAFALASGRLSRPSCFCQFTKVPLDNLRRRGVLPDGALGPLQAADVKAVDPDPLARPLGVDVALGRG